MNAPNRHLKNWMESLEAAKDMVSQSHSLRVSGQLTRVTGLVMEAVGLKMPVGSTCVIELPGHHVEAEVVGFSGEKLFLMPENDVQGLLPGARVVPAEPAQGSIFSGKRGVRRRRASDMVRHLPVGPSLLGRVLDGAGRPLDALGPLAEEETAPLQSRPVNPLDRAPIRESLDVGVRAINTLLTVGRGQRMGLFSGSGVGKSVLLGMMARYTNADVIVVGLIGERGREVLEFITDILGPQGLARSVVVAAPADTSPLMRLQGAAYATTIAEYFRDQGRNVLLIMDSLTRYAMAQREIALAIGEPPATLKAIHLRFLPSCPNWWKERAMALWAAGRSLRSIRCLPKGMTSRTPLPTARVPFSMVTSRCRGPLQNRGIIPPLTSNPPSVVP